MAGFLSLRVLKPRPRGSIVIHNRAGGKKKRLRGEIKNDNHE